MMDAIEYDPGLLNDYGGGDVGWWHDYIRSLLTNANYKAQEEVEAQVIIAVKKTREATLKEVQKLYEDMGCVPEEDNRWYSFWQVLKGGKL